MTGAGWGFDLIEVPARRGYVHVVDKQDLQRFIPLIPRGAELMDGVHTVVLDGSRTGVWGTYRPGVITLCPWIRPHGGRWWFDADGFEGTSDDLEEGLNLVRQEDSLLCSRRAATALALVDVFLHELGHHVDCQATRRRRDCPAGEDHAETFARRLRTTMWTEVQRLFSL